MLNEFNETENFVIIKRIIKYFGDIIQTEGLFNVN